MTGDSGPTLPALVIKRAFDVVLSAFALLVSFPLIALGAVAMRLETGEPGIFRQTRIGRGGQPFTIYKIRTMRTLDDTQSTVTVSGDARVTRVGAMLRRLKVDELPQLWNVLRGDMSFVGPRPDVPGYADRLPPQYQAILTMRPGITGPATLRYRDEEQILAQVEDPEWYNDNVLYVDKSRINLKYVTEYRFRYDLYYLAVTILPFADRAISSTEPPDPSRGD